MLSGPASFPTSRPPGRPRGRRRLPQGRGQPRGPGVCSQGPPSRDRGTPGRCRLGDASPRRQLAGGRDCFPRRYRPLAGVHALSRAGGRPQCPGKPFVKANTPPTGTSRVRNQIFARVLNAALRALPATWPPAPRKAAPRVRAGRPDPARAVPGAPAAPGRAGPGTPGQNRARPGSASPVAACGRPDAGSGRAGLHKHPGDWGGGITPLLCPLGAPI